MKKTAAALVILAGSLSAGAAYAHETQGEIVYTSPFYSSTYTYVPATTYTYTPATTYTYTPATTYTTQTYTYTPARTSPPRQRHHHHRHHAHPHSHDGSSNSSSHHHPYNGQSNRQGGYYVWVQTAYGGYWKYCRY